MQYSWFTDYLNKFEAYRNKRKDAGMLVIGRSTDSQVFYDSEYFCRYLAGIFKIVSINKEAYGYQTAILLQKADQEKK